MKEGTFGGYSTAVYSGGWGQAWWPLCNIFPSNLVENRTRSFSSAPSAPRPARQVRSLPSHVVSDAPLTSTRLSKVP